MGVNRVDYGDDTLIDLTADTVNADELAMGLTAHTADGEVVTGLAPKTWTGTHAMYELEKDSIPVGTIVNITDDYINPGGSGREHYSTEEQVIGTWIDGKPVYRRVFINLTFTTSEKQITIPNLKNPINIMGRCSSAFINSVLWNNSQYYASAWFSSGKISYQCGSAFNNSTGFLIVEYTKTTD